MHSSVYGWLNAILRNELNNVRRDHHRDKRDLNREQHLTHNSQMPQPALHDPALTPSSEAMRSEMLATFHKTLEQLPPDYATVIRLRSLEELPFREVAETLLDGPGVPRNLQDFNKPPGIDKPTPPHPPRRTRRMASLVEMLLVIMMNTPLIIL